MNIKATARKLTFKPRRYTTVVMLLVIFAGLAGAVFAAISVNARSRDFLIARALTTVDALSVNDIKSLQGNNQDLSSTSYQALRDRLQRIRQDNPDLQFVYLLGQRNQDIFYLVDSEPQGNGNYARPGTPYEASSRLKGVFIINNAYIEAPIRHNGNTWISAYAPVIDSSTGKAVAVLGIGVSANDYLIQMLTSAMVPLLLAAIPFAGLLRDRKMEKKEQEINQLKIQFLSIASHELRSPLAGTLWAIQSLIKPHGNQTLTRAQHELLTDVFNSTSLSLATVNEVLDFSVFERGKTSITEHEVVDLIPVLIESQKTLKLTAQEAKVSINFVGTWPEKAKTLGDISALKRSFTNVISNAIKYSPKANKVELTYSLQDGQHVVMVRDYGIGIPTKEQEKVLEGYYRASNAIKAQARGTGLGLWVSKLVIEQHKGKLWLESKENKGTSVFVALPTLETLRAPEQSRLARLLFADRGWTSKDKR